MTRSVLTLSRLIVAGLAVVATGSVAFGQANVCPPQSLTDEFICFETGTIDAATNRTSLVYTPTTPFVAGSEICVSYDVTSEIEQGGWDQVFLRFTEGGVATGPTFQDVCLAGESPGVCEANASPGCEASATATWEAAGAQCFQPTPGTTSVTVSVYVRTLDGQFQCGDCGVNAGSPGVTVNSLSVTGCNGFPTASACGDGVVDPGEQCDDQNTNSEDGCDATCQIETGAICNAAGTECAGKDDCRGVTPSSLATTYCYANGDQLAESPLSFTWKVRGDGAPLFMSWDLSGGLELGFIDDGTTVSVFDILAVTWTDNTGGGATAPIVLNDGSAVSPSAFEVWSKATSEIVPSVGATEVTVTFFVDADNTISCDQIGDPAQPLKLNQLQMTSCTTEAEPYSDFSAFADAMGGCFLVYDFNSLPDGAAAPISGDGFSIDSDSGQTITLTVEDAPYPSTFAEGDGTPALDPQIPGSYQSNSRLRISFLPDAATAIGMTFIDVGDINGIMSVEAFRDGELVHFIEDFGVGAPDNNNVSWRGLVFDQPVDEVVFSMLWPNDHFNLDNLVVIPQADLDNDGVPDICDCAPLNEDIAAQFPEKCDDGIDNDCDGFIDAADPDCGGTGTASCETYANVDLNADNGGWLVNGDAAWTWSPTLGAWTAASANNLSATLETAPIAIPAGACPGDFKVELELGGTVSADGDFLELSWSRNGGAFTAISPLQIGTLAPGTLDLTGEVSPGDTLSFRFSYVTNGSGFAAGPTVGSLRVFSDEDSDGDLVCDACDCAPTNADFGVTCDADGDGWCASTTGPLNQNPTFAGCSNEFGGGNPLVGGSDCNDGASSANPGNTDEAAFCGDGLDNDCDGPIDGMDPDCTVVSCTDNDGDGYGVGGSCLGVDCDDNRNQCTTDCTDSDNDLVPDCDDPCIDGDSDGYGVGPGCNGPDCDDAAPSCAVDCTTDLDSDLVPDCAETCVDADGDNYGIGPSCTGIDCDDSSTQCTTTCLDSDFDQIFDCKDTCLDSDGDGFGNGTTCAGADCDDGRALCTTDCTDANGNGVPDCGEACTDNDGDGYGIGPLCNGPDCDDTVSACNEVCVDSDSDGIFDCDPADSCLDKDGDNFGQGIGCSGPDCDDTVFACTSVCVDSDNDSRNDCDPLDTCLDADGDSYGEGPGCTGPDCNDQVATCAVDCTTDNDANNVPDCEQTCLDEDGDGFGVGPGCAGLDCDDAVPACTTDCSDSDNDQIPDCADTCLDADGDGFGEGAGCTAPDCDDSRQACTTDCSDNNNNATPDCAENCVDADGDGYGVGSTCVGADCDDTAASCTTTCVDQDTDGVFDCADPCVDIDRDGYGIGGGCTGPDCDDQVAICNLSCADTNGNGKPDCNEGCRDEDGDGLGVGEDCTAVDCDDRYSECTTQCVHSDDDGVPDCADDDDDGDNIPDADEATYNTNPLNPDTDGDGLRDGDEVQIYGSNPTNPDTDGDGLRDGDEVALYATLPTNPDTDGGGVNDGDEIAAQTNPLDPVDDATGEFKGNGCAGGGAPATSSLLVLLLIAAWTRRKQLALRA